MSIDTLAIAALLLSSGFFLWARTRTYLHIFQQEEYDSIRFVNWLRVQRAFDTRLTSLVLVVCVLFTVLPGTVPRWAETISVGLAMLLVAFLEKNPVKRAKKKLVLTARARRLLIATVALGWIFVAIIAATALPFVSVIVWVQAIPLFLCASRAIVEPFESRLRKKYRNEAVERLAKFAPRIVGVTGSFGKTSVKHILGHMLGMMAPTLITPGSVNTEMGISRIIRENLRQDHKYFVVEMGAYGRGSIARLCRLTPPYLAIVTGIGHAHFERFKDLETVAQTKLEIAESAVSAKGKVVVESEVLTYKAAQEFTSKHPAAIVTCGLAANAQGHVESLTQGPDGLVCELTWLGQRHELRAPLYGLHQGRNMALAFVAACSLGFDPVKCAIALRTTPQIPHRLEVTRQPQGWTLIDDGYNANPIGFESAIALLAMLSAGKGRRILITPGIVELGAVHDTEHFRLGTLAASCADVLLVVRSSRIPTFVQGFRGAAPEKSLVVECATLKEALAWLNDHVKAEDVVLIENDLPDLYEQRLAI